MDVGSRSRGAEVGVEVNPMRSVPLSVGGYVALDNSLPGRLSGNRELGEATSSPAGAGGGVSVLLISVDNKGLPNMAEIRVTTALIIATNIGVSNFLIGFFSPSGAGSAGVPPRGGLPLVGGGEGGSGWGFIGHRVPFCEKMTEIKA